MSSSIASRRDEIVAKKAKLAELKRQRELRQREFTTSRQSVSVSGGGSDASEVWYSSIGLPEQRKCMHVYMAD